MEYKTYIDKTVKELAENKLVSVYDAAEPTYLADEQLRELSAELAASKYKPLLPAIERLMQLPVKFSLSWEYNLVGTYEMGGQIHLHNIALAILDDKYALARHDRQPGGPEIKYIDKDLLNGEIDGTVIIISLPDTNIQIGNWLNKKFYPFTIDLDKYIELLYITKGFVGWSYMYCATLEDDLKTEMYNNYWKRMMTDLPRLFPDVDYTDLEKQLKALMPE